MAIEPTDPARSARPEDCLAGGGEMGALMRSIDWSRTGLRSGDVGWPQSLRTAVSIMLESRFAMVVAWGPSSASSTTIGTARSSADQAPGGAGPRRARRSSPRSGTSSGPSSSASGGAKPFAIDDWLLPARPQRLPGELLVHAFLQPDPRRDAAASAACSRWSRRRPAASKASAGWPRCASWRRRAAEATTPEAACADAAAVLRPRTPSTSRSLLVYLLEPGTAPRRAGSSATGLPDGHPAARGHGRPRGGPDATGAWPLARALAAREPQSCCEDLDGALRRAARRLLPRAHAHGDPAAARPRPGRTRPYGVLVAGVSPRRALDDAYRGFFELAADHIATAISNARAFEEERAPRRGAGGARPRQDRVLQQRQPRVPHAAHADARAHRGRAGQPGAGARAAKRLRAGAPQRAPAAASW